MHNTIERANSSTQMSAFGPEEMLSNMISWPDIQLVHYDLEDVELLTTEVERDDHGNIIPKTPDVTDGETKPLSDCISSHREPPPVIRSRYGRATKHPNAKTRSNQPTGSSPKGDSSCLSDMRSSTSDDALCSPQTIGRHQQNGSCLGPRIAEHPDIRLDSNSRLIIETRVSKEPILHPSSKSTPALFVAPLTNASITSELQLCTQNLRCNEQGAATYLMSRCFSTPDMPDISPDVS